MQIKISVARRMISNLRRIPPKDSWPRIVTGLFVELVQPLFGESVGVIVLNDLISVHNDGYEQAENDVDEQTDEDVEVNLGEGPNHCGIRRSGAESGEHVVAVDQTEQTLGRGQNGLELEVIRTQNDPAAEYESEVD